MREPGNTGIEVVAIGRLSETRGAPRGTAAVHRTVGSLPGGVGVCDPSPGGAARLVAGHPG